MSDLNCPFRQDVCVSHDSETATCGFIQSLTQLDAACCSVDRSACEACLQHSPFAPAQLNPVMPSLMIAACESSAPLAVGSPAAALHAWATSTIAAQSLPCLVPITIACDVVLLCRPGDEIASAVESVFQQDGVFIVLHLVAAGPAAQGVVDPFAAHAGIRTHQLQQAINVWAAIQNILPEFETPWIAVQTADSISAPERLRESITTLLNSRSEILAAGFQVGSHILESTLPDEAHFAESLIGETLVVRRTSLVDMGGFDISRGDAGTEFAFRAAREGRRIEIDHRPLVTKHITEPPQHDNRFDQPPPAYLDQQIADMGRLDNTTLCTHLPADARPLPVRPDRPSLRHFSSGFADSPSRLRRCDVVLPFRDDLDFVGESMDALLRQTDADIVIHLVDDASVNSTDAFLHQYRKYANVRIYRNSKNLGPFTTFNNVSEFAETEFIAVQDADDISLPHRIARSVQLLHLTGADVLGTSTELFGDAALVENIARECRISASGHPKYVRYSRYPDPQTVGYFLENPTLTIRLNAFRQLGGYADFGEGKRNRTGVDTELQVRAHFSQIHIAVTNEILVRYRCHGTSATNHAASGFGSVAQIESHTELRRRVQHYATGSFNPKWFGALGQHFGITQKL